MARDHTPYEYGDADTDGGLDDGDPPKEHESGVDTVIVDGDAMTYRSYEKRRGGETQ